MGDQDTNRINNATDDFWPLSLHRQFQLIFVAMSDSSACASTTTSQESFAKKIYQWHEEVENLEQYCPGGYHPVHISDEYSNGRYQIVHKLGFGSYSTVWLAKDKKANRYVALKIILADASEKTSEGRVLRHLRKTLSSPADRVYINPFYDEFIIDGPNGRHLCVVTKPAGCSVGDSRNGYYMFPIGIARAIAAQTVLGLKAIHSQGVIHGGRWLWRSRTKTTLTTSKIYMSGIYCYTCRV